VAKIPSSFGPVPEGLSPTLDDLFRKVPSVVVRFVGMKVSDFAKNIILDPVGYQKLQEQYRKGVGNAPGMLPPQTFDTLLAYGFGRPTQVVDVTVRQAEDLSLLSYEELLQRTDALRGELLDCAATEESLKPFIEGEFKTEP
jgi:hypothetical protein